MRTSWLLVLLAMAWPLVAFGAEGGEADGEATAETQSLAILESLLPSNPAIATRETVEVLTAAAETRRLDAAYLLIRGLAFNFDPHSSNEKRSLSDMIPAVGLLRKYYSEDVLPVLVFEGLATEHFWLRQRVALAVREIAGRDRIEELEGIFSLRENKSSSAKELVVLLEVEQIRIELYSQSLEAAEQALKGLKKTSGDD